ncbi:peptide ABC transporter substrate-binding protein [Oenococcus oeni]|uniref:ABC-type oligopeptide transport system, periplasmic component n=1 Tax=Oenococcus oeni (strain ATCC BAA-331 / PSU-1) TaxID=203123 RepID=Q04FL0_OENOB|nr:peptide ABC transporter substrate-binding protein [Oenococcus oeni]ABJ56762.1 ABC-type oligopeptide transport system, periplasmic component [Oenococcus oeni PSU-1]OIK68059.1 peptide ABC transporter substrate-binding protein [Oenococcus oeni]OIL14926.1 peptide ABC transporter substrate-binding protein [Oenococcus oeni]OIL29628.1 peptide ABC transporter substrate-binding protein [Oenococcus oeni]OIL81574.1 peptide ABC transporter substrate-binding protein [Oenococcus oeni]
MARKKKMSTGKKVGITALAAVIVIGGVAGYATLGKKSTTSNVLNEYLPVDMTTQDLSQMTDSYAFEVAANVQQGLLSRTSSGAPKAGLAKSWSHSKDGLTWTFHLRRGLKWSNGDPLTASDFVYAWQRTVNPKTASQYAYIYSGIKNADAINSGKNKDLSSLGIKAKNKTTLVVTLEHPMPQFQNLMAFPVFFAQDKKFESSLGSKVGTSSSKQVYSGPYKFVGWNGSNKKFKLVPNKNYWDAKAVKNKGVNFQVVTDTTAALALYNKGELDQVTLSTPQQIKKYKNSKNFKIYNQSQTDYLEYNQTGKVKGLTNAKIREALNLATDRKTIANSVSEGLDSAATGITPAGLAKTATGGDFAKAAAKATAYAYNIKKAKKLFAEGMKEVGLKKLTLTIEGSSDSTVTKSTLDTLQQSWSELPGLTVKEKLVPFKQRLLDQENHNFDVVLAAWSADYSEPLTFLNMFVTGGSNNDGSWSNKEYDALIKSASDKNALSDTKRTADEIKAEKVLYQNAGVNPVFWVNAATLSNSKVKGVQYFSSGAPYYFWNAYRSKK